MKKITIIIGVAVIIVAVAIVSLCIGKNKTNNEINVEPEKSMVTINVNEVTRSVFYAPQYAAIANGYFEKYGIKIELTTGQGADQVMTAVLSGQSDIGFAGPEASIYVYNEGKEDYTEVFAQLTKKDGAFLVSRENIEHFSWACLKGKVVIPGRKGGVPYMTFEYVLKKNGLTPNVDVTLDDSIKFDLMAGAFAAGNADFVTLFEPTASQVQLADKGYVIASIGEAAGEIPYTAYFAKKSYISEHEELIQNFTNAVYEGQLWVKNHTAREVAEAIKEFFPDTDIDLLEKVMQKYMDIDAWNETPFMKEEAFNRLQEVMTEAGELECKVPYDKVVNNKYAENAIKNIK